MTELAHAGGRARSRVLRDVLTNVSLMAGVLIILVIILAVLFGPLIAPYNPYLVDRIVYPHYDFEEEVYIRTPVQPNAEFPFGTNDVGMDLYSLILHGARNTLIAGVLIALARVVLGLFIGLGAGWFEGSLLDRGVMGLVGVLTSLPILISGMLLIFVLGLGGGMVTFFIALSAIGWTEVAQYIRGEVLVARKMPYMEAARSIGLREIEIAIRHVIPNILPQLFVISFLEVGAVLMLLGELALIGVFIGGGSSLDFSDIGSTNVVALPTQPEWGALIANGFRWLRSNPHMVLYPAAAVFVAVLGFNAIGEGLRGLFEKRGIQASFIISRRMLLVLALVFAAMFAIFQSTQPVRWFRDLAHSFSSAELETDERVLAGLQGLHAAPGQPAPYAIYIAEQLDEYGYKGGIRWSDFYMVRTENLYEPAAIPQLTLLDESGQPNESFEYGADFAYVLGSHGGAGDATGTLTLLRVWPDLDPETVERLGARSFEGQIVLLEEGNAPVEMAASLVRRGAAGVLWLAQTGAQLRDARLAPIQESGEGEAGNGDGAKAPIFRISQAAGARILAAASLSLAGFEAPPPEPLAGAAAPAILATDVRIHMQLALQDAVPLEITNMVAYIQGTDGRLGDEIILFVLTCDGLWRADQPVEVSANHQPRDCMAALPIEFSRMFAEAFIDLRRPIMVLLWGGGEFSYAGVSEWLSDPNNFGHLSAPGMRLQPRPHIVVQLEPAGSHHSHLTMAPDKTGELMEIFARATRWADVELEPTTQPAAYTPIWVSPEIVPHQTTIALDASGAQAQEVGESFSLALIRLVREGILSN